MKFTTAWEKVIKDNMHLKILSSVLTITTISLLITTSSLALRAPIIIERGCFSKSSTLGDKKQTPIEYEEFLKIAIKQRFNSNAEITEGYISVSEKKNKEKEQKTLLKNNLEQIVYIRKFDFTDNLINLDIDRTYSIGNVRSTLPMKLNVTLETKDRTRTNPYGLILVKSEELKEIKDKK